MCSSDLFTILATSSSLGIDDRTEMNLVPLKMLPNSIGHRQEIHDIGSIFEREKPQRLLTSQRFTIEALAADIVSICLSHSGVKSARVRVEKPGALRFASSVGVEIERSAN